MATTVNLHQAIHALPFFDTHSHMAGMDTGGPLDDRGDVTLPAILEHDYLAYLANACCDVPVHAQNLFAYSAARAAGQFHALQPLLDACRALSTYAALRDGIRALYPFEGADIAAANWEGINRQILDTYRRLGVRAWQREVLRRAGVVRQVHICQFPYVAEHWAALPPDERAAQSAVLRPSLVLDGLAFTGLQQNTAMRARAMALLGLQPGDYTAYLDFCRTVLDRFQAGGGSSVKILAAYVRTLRFEPVPAERARDLFARGFATLPVGEQQALQDHLVFELLAMARERHLPLLVHTGYAIPTAWGDPEHLLPLCTHPRLAQLKIALVHAGWPHSGGALLMARTYRNCYLDLAWIPLLSPAIAAQLLAEAADTVPMNKIMIGTDCGTVESFYGTVGLIRRLLAEVLQRKVDQGQFSSTVALAFARRILYETAAEFFNEPIEKSGAVLHT